MREFIITDNELDGKKTSVLAPGIIEAMYEYLPWPTVEVNVYWSPISGSCIVTDKKTQFEYKVTSNRN